MKEQLIQEVQRQMLPYLNNAQLKQLQGVLEGVLSGVELSHSAGMVESAKVGSSISMQGRKSICKTIWKAVQTPVQLCLSR